MKKKDVPAMYPKPDPIRLSRPLKFVSVDTVASHIELECTDEDDAALLIASHAAAHRKRDLRARLNEFLQLCQSMINPHFGDRPEYITPEQWESLVQRLRLLRSLPADAPAEAHCAFEALQAIFELLDELVKVGDLPEVIDRAICCAIGLGMLLQRIQTQIDHGATVDEGKRSVQSRSSANQAKSEAAKKQSDKAFQEYKRRIEAGGKKNHTLKNMSDVKDHNGNRVYGSFGTLKRWSKAWPDLTPSE